MKRTDELLGMPVLTVQEGARLGKLKGVEIAYRDGQILYVQFDGADGRPDGMVHWSKVRAIGADAITIESLAVIQECVDAGDRDRVTPRVGERAVVTESGTRLGHITNYDLDEATGQILRYHIATGGLLGRVLHTEVSFEQSAIRAFGEDAIVVSDEVLPSQQ